MENKTTVAEHKIICENRKKLIITGVDKVDRANLNQIALLTMGACLYDLGKNLHVQKLDVASGHIEINGEIDSIKYADKKPSIIKRIFK